MKEEKCILLALPPPQAREGCHVNPTQLGSMFHRVADQVEPIYNAIAATVPDLVIVRVNVPSNTVNELLPWNWKHPAT
jgi:hypothetical protein